MKLGPNQRGLLMLLSKGPRKAPEIAGSRTAEATVATLKRLRARGLVETDSPSLGVWTWSTRWSLTAAGREAICK